MEPDRTSRRWMSKSPRHGNLETKSSDALRRSKNSQFPVVRRLARIRHVHSCPFRPSIGFVDWKWKRAGQCACPAVHDGSSELHTSRERLSSETTCSGGETIQDWSVVTANPEAWQNNAKLFPVVKPDATAEEVAAVVDNTDGAGGQIFSQAVRSVFPAQLSYLSINDPHSSQPQPRMVSPEQHTRRSRIATKTSRKLSARSKSLLSYSMTYPSAPCHPQVP